MQQLKDFTGLVSKKFIKIISTVGCFGSKFHMARINYQKHSLCTWLLHNITRRLKIVLAVFENCFGKFLWWCFFSCGIKNVQKNVCHYKNQHSSQYVCATPTTNNRQWGTIFYKLSIEIWFQSQNYLKNISSNCKHTFMDLNEKLYSTNLERLFITHSSYSYS